MVGRIEISGGETFPGSRLTVIREVEPRQSGKQRQRCVECRCECGDVRVYRVYTLRNGNTKSCGCLAVEVAGLGALTHGGSKLPEYGIWHGMLSRCRNMADKNYGGRGIWVCDRWKESFAYFLEDMGRRPSDKHSIDRKDVNGGYEAGNCRWATSKEQARNTRFNYLVEHDGETKCVADWAEQYGFRASVLYGRLVRLGWTFEKAVSWPVNVRRPVDPFYQTPMKERGLGWQLENSRREANRIASDRRELERIGESLAKTHRVDASEFKSRVDAALVEGWTWNGSVFRALREMGAVK